MRERVRRSSQQAAQLRDTVTDEVVVVGASAAQRAYWIAEIMASGSTAYNLSAALRLDGRIDHQALRQAFAEVTAQYDILRTGFELGDDGRLEQVIHTSVASEYEFRDLSHLDEPGKAQELSD